MADQDPQLKAEAPQESLNLVFQHVPNFDDPVRFQEHLKIDLGLASNPNFETFLEAKRQSEAYEKKSFDEIRSNLEIAAGAPIRVAATLQALEKDHDDVLDNFDRSYFLRKAGHRDFEYERVRSILSEAVNDGLVPPTYSKAPKEMEEKGRELDSIWLVSSIHLPKYWNEIKDKRVKRAILKRMIDKAVGTGVTISTIGAWLMHYGELKRDKIINAEIESVFDVWMEAAGGIFIFDQDFFSRFSSTQVTSYVTWWAKKNKDNEAFNQLESALWKRFRDIFNYTGDCSVFPRPLRDKIESLVLVKKDQARAAGTGFQTEVEAVLQLGAKPVETYEPGEGRSFQRVPVGGYEAEVALKPNEMLVFVSGKQKDLKVPKLESIRLAFVRDPETAAVKVNRTQQREAAQIISYTAVEAGTENQTYETLPEAKGQMMAFANDRFSFCLAHKEAELVFVEFLYEGKRVSCLYDKFSDLNFPADFFGLTAADIESGDRPEIKNVQWLKKASPEAVGISFKMKETPKEEPPEEPEKTYSVNLSGRDEEGRISLNIPAFWPEGCCLHLAIWQMSAKRRPINRQHKCFSSVTEMLAFDIDFSRYEIRAVFSNRSETYNKNSFPEGDSLRVSFPEKSERRQKSDFFGGGGGEGRGSDSSDSDENDDEDDNPELTDWGLIEMAVIEAIGSELLSGQEVKFEINLQDLLAYLPAEETFLPQVCCLVSESEVSITNFLGQTEYEFADSGVAGWFKERTRTLFAAEQARQEEAEREVLRAAEEAAERARVEDRRKENEAVMALGAFPKELEEAEGLLAVSQKSERTFTHQKRDYYLWQKHCSPNLLATIQGLLGEKKFGFEIIGKAPLEKVKITRAGQSALFDVSSSERPETMTIESEASIELVAQMRVALKLAISYMFSHYIATDKEKNKALKARRRESKGATDRLLTQAEKGTLSLSHGFDSPEPLSKFTWEDLALLDIDDRLLAARGAIAFARQEVSTVHFSNADYEALEKIIDTNDGFFLRCLIERAIDTFEEGNPEKKSIGNTLAVRILVQHMFEGGITPKDLEIYKEMPQESVSFWKEVFKDWQDHKVPLEINAPLERSVGDLLTARRRKS